MIQVGIRQEVMITGVAQVIMKHKRSDSIYTRQRCNYCCISITSSFIMCGIIPVIYFSLFTVNPQTVLSLCQKKPNHLPWNQFGHMQVITRHQRRNLDSTKKIMGYHHIMCIEYFFTKYEEALLFLDMSIVQLKLNK